MNSLTYLLLALISIPLSPIHAEDQTPDQSTCLTIHDSPDFKILNDEIHIKLSALFVHELKQRYNLSLKPTHNNQEWEKVLENIIDQVILHGNSDIDDFIIQTAHEYFRPFFEDAQRKNIRKKVRDLYEKVFIELLKKYYGITVPGRYHNDVVSFGKKLTIEALDIHDPNVRNQYIKNQSLLFLKNIFESHT